MMHLFSVAEKLAKVQRDRGYHFEDVRNFIEIGEAFEADLALNIVYSFMYQGLAKKLGCAPRLSRIQSEPRNLNRPYLPCRVATL